MVDQERQSSHWNNQELHSEGIMVAVICSLELEVYQINSGHCGSNEDDLHDSVVNRDEVCEQIQVPCDEDQAKHDLTLSRQTCEKKNSS